MKLTSVLTLGTLLWGAALLFSPAPASAVLVSAPVEPKVIAVFKSGKNAKFKCGDHLFTRSYKVSFLKTCQDKCGSPEGVCLSKEPLEPGRWERSNAEFERCMHSYIADMKFCGACG